MKLCIRCQVKKSLSEFHKQEDKADGHRSVCKTCRLSDTAIYYRQNREKVKHKWKEYRKKHPDYLSNYYSKNKEYFENYRKSHKEHYRNWRRRNKRHLAKYRKRLKETDPNFKVACALRSSISIHIRRAGVVKSERSNVLLGCSIDDFRKYLEDKFLPGMSWNNYGKWHIDHIIPCSSFNLAKVSEQMKCFHYSNQQPLWKLDNLKKGNR